MNQKIAGQLARKGFENYKNNRFIEAKKLYMKALEMADPVHWAIEDYHGEFSLVLNALGEKEEAQKQLEYSLCAAKRNSKAETNLNVTIALHFLAEHLIDTKQHEKAIFLLKEYFGFGCEKEWLLAFSLAKAYQGLADMDMAKKIIDEAILNASKQEKAEVKRKLSGVLNGKYN